MKRTLKSVAYLLISALIFTACADEKTGKSPDQLVEEIDVNPEDLNEIIPIVETDTLVEEVKVVPPPPPMPEPEPWPEPEPRPDPNPWPNPGPPPEPEPIPNPDDQILEFTDIEPQFPGGEKAMMKFIQDNIQYPAIDREEGNQGKVYVEFIVEKDGSLTGIKVLRGVSAGIDKEAMRIVRKMPNWKPAEAGGKVVRSISRLPFTFRLD